MLQELENSVRILKEAIKEEYMQRDCKDLIKRRLAGMISERVVALFYNTEPMNLELYDTSVLKGPDMLFFKNPSIFEIKTTNEYKKGETGRHMIKKANKDIPCILCNVDLSEFEFNTENLNVSIERDLENLRLGSKYQEVVYRLEMEERFFKEKISLNKNQVGAVELLGIATPELMHHFCRGSSFNHWKEPFQPAGIQYLEDIPTTIEELNDMGMRMEGVNYEKLKEFIENMEMFAYDKFLINSLKQRTKEAIINAKEDY